MSSSEPNVLVSNSAGDGPTAHIAATPVAGDVLSGHRIIEKLTSGGFGTVFLAENLSLPGQLTVVKTMPLGQLIEREANVLQHIDHPTVVKILAVGRTESFQYIVMEYLKGETLDALLGKYRQFGPIQAVRIGVRIADALEAVHEKGLVHRDLKPANIMLKLAKDHGKFVDWLKLIDFGLARDHGHQLTIAEGTPEYVAPETLQQQPVTPSSDLYALGVLMHEMLTGQRPYQASSVNLMVSQHVNAAVPHVRDSAPDVSGELDALVYELMSKDPASRPSSASEVAKRLARLERELSDGSTGISTLHGQSGLNPMPGTSTLPLPLPLIHRVSPEPTPLLLPDKMKPKRWPWLLALLLLLLLLGGFFMWPESAPKRSPAAEPTPAPPEAIVAAAASAAVATRPGQDDEMTPLPIGLPPLNPTPVAPVESTPVVIAKRQKTELEFKAPECEPDQRWKAGVVATLMELSKKFATDPVKNAIYVNGDREISPLVERATSATECAHAEQLMMRLKNKLGVPE